jgi:hypothetical protein
MNHIVLGIATVFKIACVVGTLCRTVTGYTEALLRRI